MQREIIELTGEPGVGKSTLSLDLTANGSCILFFPIMAISKDINTAKRYSHKLYFPLLNQVGRLFLMFFGMKNTPWSTIQAIIRATKLQSINVIGRVRVILNVFQKIGMAYRLPMIDLAKHRLVVDEGFTHIIFNLGPKAFSLVKDLFDQVDYRPVTIYCSASGEFIKNNLQNRSHWRLETGCVSFEDFVRENRECGKQYANYLKSKMMEDAYLEFDICQQPKQLLRKFLSDKCRMQLMVSSTEEL